ncbi:putative metallocarboxypeptidase inhibitor-like [Capsicum annuum]|uniref:J domain-containing protein n=1 Tax=Capsicum annuum TaxID=4072 RepID=A0A1U8F2W3_CAPAN|nr:uncharacterized protein LOC107853225 [Capsicum annuum]KAF3653724.1 putative metallocarboxypeptidase inhibitor-like [Capsicum annuum]KAF3655587.1 putative metallocarboxypeptidase inhibitor-like [Capsicum annuum]PHT75456.1 hypothetical protein T459_18978 [Capsicum annuum]
MEHPFFINGPPTNRSEALRWLSIAEKLLTNRDLVGSKSFATRARESDPSLAHPIDQILSIVDTLTAGDKRINNHHFDYYSILQVPPNQTQNFEFIADQYRRFALLLNPQNNTFPFSDQAFGLVVDAFSVLSDPMRKSMYDKELGFFINLYPVAAASAASVPTSVSFVQQQQQQPQHSGSAYGHMQGSNTADQLFVNMPSQDSQGSFSRDPQTGISSMPMPVTFMGSSGSEQEQQQQQQQPPVMSMRQQQAQQQQQPPVSSLSFSNIDEQPATFLNLNQPQPVSSERSLNRENPPPFGIGLSSTRGREPEVVSVEQQRGKQQPPERRNENVVGNNENTRAASTSNNNVKEKEGRVDGSESRNIPSFWTACPYCYVMHEYPLEYVDCTLKCQNCRRAFQAVKVAAPPIVDGKEAYFCCWGFMPLGFSVESYQRSRNNVSSWSPFSPMFAVPSSGVNEGRKANNHAVGGQGNVSTYGNLHNAGGSRSRAGRKQSAPRMIYSDDDDDDDDVLVDISEVLSDDA